MSNNKQTKIIESLSWKALKEAFIIGTVVVPVDGKNTEVVVNALQNAIDDGTIDAMVNESAKLYHDGNTSEVFKALNRNLQSQRCNMDKRAFIAMKDIEELRYTTLRNYVDSNIAKIAKTYGVANANKPQWAYGPEEIDAIEDAAQLQKVINSISDACSESKFNAEYEVRLGENYREVAKANRSYARKRKAELENKANSKVVEDATALLAKLDKGTKTTLSAEEAAKLAELLKTLK